MAQLLVNTLQQDLYFHDFYTYLGALNKRCIPTRQSVLLSQTDRRTVNHSWGLIVSVIGTGPGQTHRLQTDRRAIWLALMSNQFEGAAKNFSATTFPSAWTDPSRAHRSRLRERASLHAHGDGNWAELAHAWQTEQHVAPRATTNEREVNDATQTHGATTT